MYKAELEIAIEAVRNAAIVCQAVQRNLVSGDTLEKKDKSPVTVADFASQAIVCKTLMTQFPDDLLVGEEDAKELREEGQEILCDAVVKHVGQVIADANKENTLSWIDRGGATGLEASRYWTLDPIDGTKGFLRGEQYAIALALIENGEVVLGVLGCPNLVHGETEGVIVTAIKGKGAKRMTLELESDVAEDIWVHQIGDVSDARFCESVESGHSSHDHAGQIAGRLRITNPSVRMDSQAKYATIAQGKAEIYLRLPTRAGYEEKIWDHAAGMLVLEEAGGIVTDVYGKKLDYTHGSTLKENTGVIASNAKIHDEVIAAVKAVLGI